MEAAELLRVVARLDDRGVDVWVDGGWGVDALVGEQTRPHDDLDLVVARSDLPRAESALAPLGFAHASEADPGLPARLVLRAADGRQVDLHPVVFDERGNGLQELGDGTWGAYPAAGLAGLGRIAGRPVPCLTAELQVRFHLGYERRPADRHDLALLRVL
jgi:lincosamide nucleotidyltransferase A/C/D/E